MQPENGSTEVAYVPAHEDIAKLAYKLWTDGGRQEGVEKENWRAAVAMLIAKHRHQHHHGDHPHSTEEGEHTMNQNQTDEQNQEIRSNQYDAQENDAQQGHEQVKNQGGTDNTEDANPMNTDKSNQPPIGGSEETDPDSPTHTGNVGVNPTQGGNGDPATGNPLTTGADTIQEKNS